MDNFPASAEILDESGIILYVNEAWRLFAGEHGLAGQDYGVGKNYLDLCRAMLDQESPEMEAAVARLCQVMKKSRGKCAWNLSARSASGTGCVRPGLIRQIPDDHSKCWSFTRKSLNRSRQKRSSKNSGRLINPQEQESERLTARQREVVQLLAEGRSMKEIASILNITTRTVAYHKYTVMEQHQIKTCAGLNQNPYCVSLR